MRTPFTHRWRPALFSQARALLLLALLLLSASLSTALAERRERLIDGWRPLHYEVSLVFDERLTEISRARTEVTVRLLKDGVRVIDFDFGEMPVDGVLVAGRPATFTQSDGKLMVSLARPARRDERVRVSISYHGRPKDGLIFSPDKDGRQSATGDNWPDRVHHWIPTFDHPSAKATVRFTVTAPASAEVVANGRLEATRAEAHTTRTWVWNERVPISPYCMVVAIGDFARLEPKRQTVTPLSYYVPHSERKYALLGFAMTDPALKYFSQTVGPYPYEKLAMIVGATRYGGMENSSAIIFGSTLFTNFETKQPRSRRYDIPISVRGVIAHEVAHQWFGDSVTEATWADLWLSEGFANYFEALFIEKHEGRTAFLEDIRASAGLYFTFAKERRIPLHDRETEDLTKLLNANNYHKGSWVLHMLRGILGDRDFFEGIRDYYRRHRDATATSEDLRAAMEKASGRNLKDFFTRWVYQSGHPRYQATWRWEAATRDASGAGHVELRIRQLQEDEFFSTPLTVEIVTTDGARRMTVTPSGKDYTVRLQSARLPTELRLDPDEFVLKEMTLERLR